MSQAQFDYEQNQMEEFYNEARNKAYSKFRNGKRRELRSTEHILNADYWVDANGEKHELDTMDTDHLRNVLGFLYKKRDNLWINCNDASMIEMFENGEEFFQIVIRKSTFWEKAIEQLTDKQKSGFNFKF